MGDLIFFVSTILGLCLTAWVAWRVGHDSAQREAFYTISELRRSLRAQQLESDRLREHNRLMAARLDRANVIVPEVPQWMR